MNDVNVFIKASIIVVQITATFVCCKGWRISEILWYSYKSP